MKHDSSPSPIEPSLPAAARQAASDLRARGPSEDALVRLRASLGGGGSPSPAGHAKRGEGLEPLRSAGRASGSALGRAIGAVVAGASLAGAGWYLSAHRSSSTSPAGVTPAAVSASPTSMPEPHASVPVETRGAPEAGSPAAATTQSARPVMSGAPSTAASGDSGPSETQLIGRAQMLVHTNPQKALMLCEEHARRYPNGMLVQEREVLMVEALKRTGRDREAAEASEQLLQANPDTAHRNKLKVLIGDSGGAD